MSLYVLFSAFNMGDLTLKLFGAALLGVFTVLILRKSNADGAVPLRMVIGVILAAGCIMLASPVFEFVNELSSLIGGVGGEIYIETLLKALGIAIITHICSTVCRDCGEGSVAGYVELGGKIEIVLLSLPLIREILSSSIELLEMK